MKGSDPSKPPARGQTPAPNLSPKKAKRSFKEEREYKELLARIAALEAEQKTLEAAVAHPDFYKKGKDVIKQTLSRIEVIDRELLDATARWDVLDSLQK